MQAHAAWVRQLGAAILVPLLSVAAPAGEPVVAGSLREVAVAIEPGRGDLVSLICGGREFAAGRQPLFHIKLTDPETHKIRSLSSRDAEKVAVRSEGAARAKRTVSKYTFSDELEVEVVFGTRAGSDELETSIDVVNRTGLILEEVRYPNFRLKGKLGESARSVRLFMPGGDGYVVTRAGLLRQAWHQRAYPAQASMQYMAYYDADGGLTLQTRDPNALPKEFGGHFERPNDRLTFVVIHHLPFEVNRRFTSSPIALLRCKGTWMAAAAKYRLWARKQFWAKPKRGQDAPPKWLCDGFLTLGGCFRPLGIGKHVVPSEKWPEVTRSWREATGATNIMLDVRGWERHGQYCSPFYFPMYPSDEGIKAVFDACLAERAHAMAMVSGLKWMIHREALPGKSYHVLGFDFRDRFDEKAKGICVIGREGKVHIREPRQNWDGRLAFMCPAHEFTVDHFRKTARTLAQAGFALFEFDQMNGGYCPHCYSSDHGHPRGPGIWQRQAIAGIMAVTRAEGRKINPRFATSLEDPQEVYLPQLDSYVSRAGHISKWPGAGAGSVVVPAFTFVYHPLARAIGFDVQNSPNADPYQILQMGRYFISGTVPSTNMGWWQLLGKYGKDDLLPAPRKIHADQLKLLKAITVTHCGPGLPYLGFGEMLAADTTELCPQQWTYRHWTGEKMIDRTITHPAVMASAWQAGTGRRAFVFVNMAKEAKSFDYDFAVEGRQPAPDTSVHVHLNGEPQPAGTGATVRRVSMPALSTLIVELASPSRTSRPDVD